MKITPVNNNQSFGMALKIDSKGARKFAEEIQRRGGNFVENMQKVEDDILKPINELTTLVKITDDGKVIVSNSTIEKSLEVLDGTGYPYLPWQSNNGHVLNFHVKDVYKGEEKSTYSVLYPRNIDDANISHYVLDWNPSLEATTAYAREIAKDMDEAAIQQLQNDVAIKESEQLLKEATAHLLELYK